MNNFQEQGRACYKRGDYQRAIELFDRAIGHAASAQLLDNRAACHEKLHDFQAALKDAKKTIQLHREDPTGYLRAGKVLKKMEKDPVALEIYTHGLKCIKHVGQGYELLRSAQKSLMEKLSPPNSVDPLTRLPRELAEMVLEYLSFKQRVNACLVSKQWAQFIRSCPDLWRHLDLSHAKRKVKNVFIARAINVARRKLTKATLSDLCDTEKSVATVIKNCALKELILFDPGLQSRHLTHILPSARTLKKLVLDSADGICHFDVEILLTPLSAHIEHFQCRTNGTPMHFTQDEVFHKLRILSLTYEESTNPTTLFFDQLPVRMPALECLTIRNESSRQNPVVPINLDSLPLRYLDLRLVIPSSASLKLPTTLVGLKLSSPTRPSGAGRDFWFVQSPSGLVEAPFYLPRLEEIHLDIHGTILSNVRHALAGRDGQGHMLSDGSADVLSKLRKVTIIGSRLNYIQISEIFKHPRLDSLDLLHLPQLESCCDDDVSKVMESLPKLKSLDLSETDITGVAVRKAVEPGHLKELIVNNCRHLGLDAVEWARTQGVKVQYRMFDGLNGGKKIRH